MARLDTAPIPARDYTAINLERLLGRLQKIILGPDTLAGSQSYAEWVKTGANLEYARGLLVRVEQDAQNIKVQARKQEIQADLVRKHYLIQRLGERLEELTELASYEEEGDDSSEGEDLLAQDQDTPSETTDETTNTHEGEERSTLSSTDYTPPPTTHTEPASPPLQPHNSPPPESSTLRSRNPRTELFGTATDKAYTTSSSIHRSVPNPSQSTTTTTTNNSHERNAPHPPPH
ncbi:hypothetical protein DID88_002884 [Monilinia fructigena]|uniref:Uncharacterized protein n=1 Tax=Monilinia fructigena TaxID=38457 RepID=A0A395INU8_9HELO|nr:hypothetical protein DID88_002884 [Monilinia fructigena]